MAAGTLLPEADGSGASPRSWYRFLILASILTKYAQHKTVSAPPSGTSLQRWYFMTHRSENNAAAGTVIQTSVHFFQVLAAGRTDA